MHNHSHMYGFFPILLLVSWVEMQWYFLLWRKANRDDCRALTAAVSGYGIKLVKWESFESRGSFRNRKSNTKKKQQKNKQQNPRTGSHSTPVALALCHCSGMTLSRWVPVSEGRFCAVFSGMWAPWSLCCCLAVLRMWRRWGARLDDSSVSWEPLTQASRAQDRGAEVCLHAISSSDAWNPASDKSICSLSVSLHSNFATSATCKLCLLLFTHESREKIALPPSSTKGQHGRCIIAQLKSSSPEVCCCSSCEWRNEPARNGAIFAAVPQMLAVLGVKQRNLTTRLRGRNV